MTTVLSRALPPPANWQDFERLCFDLYARSWRTSDAALNGRSGQSQAGVDVYGTDRVEDRFTGVQCKGKDGDYGVALTRAELLAEIEKAKRFIPPLEVFILATSAPDDAALQIVAREISRSHKAQGLFEVRVQGWGTLKQILTDHLDVVRKHFPDLAPTAVEDQIAASTQFLSSQLTEAVQVVKATFEAVVEGNGRDSGAAEDPIGRKIDVIAALIVDGDAAAALKALTRLEAELEPDVSMRTRYRLRANIGSALLNLGRFSEAIKAFEDAYEMDPEWPNAIAILATARLVGGDREGAYAQAVAALARDAECVQAVSVLIDAAPDAMDLSAVEARVPQALRSQVHIAVSLSVRATRLGDHKAALAYAQQAYELDAEDWRSLSALAETSLRPLLDAPEISLSHHVLASEAPRFERAVEMLERAWAIMRDRADVIRGVHVASNLVAVLEVAGRLEDSEAVLDEGLRAVPDYAPLLRQHAHTSVRKDDWASVRRAVDRIAPDDLEETDRAMAIQADLHLDAVEAGLEKARALERETASLRIQELAAGVQIEGAARLGETVETAERLMRAYPASITIRSAAVGFLPETAPLRATALEELKGLIDEITDPRDRFHAAEALFATGDYSRAADLYATVSSPDKASLPLRRRLVALYNADRRREARKLFERLPVAVRSQPAYAELGFAIYERSGLLAKAKASLEIALAVEPFDLELRLKWINAAERSGRGGEVADWLKQVPPTLEGRPEQLMTLAGTMDRLGVHGGVLPLAYRALRAGYSNPRIHTSYTLGLFIIGRAGKAERTTPEVAGPDVAVTLEEVAGDRTLVYVLETAPDPRIERQEIAWDGDLAKQLTGVRIGDRIELSNLGRDASYFTVTGLMDKYLHAHFRSLNDFRSLFPSDKTLGQFTFDPDAPMESLRPLLDDVRDRRTRGETLQQHYMSGALPVAVLGQLTGTSAFDVWEGIRASRDLIFMTAVGTVEESVGGVERAAAAKSAVVDPVTLYGLARLGIVGNVIAGFDEVGLVQGTLDLLRTHYEDCVEAARNGGGSLQAVGEGFALLESTEADQKARIDEAAEILAFAETLPIYPSEAIQPIAEAAQAIFMSLPPAYVDTVFAAQVPGRVLLCDDRAMRLLAETAGLITAVWSQAAVAASAQAGRLTTPQIIQATLAFIHAKSVFTMVPAWLVGAIIDQADWSVTNADVGTIIDHTTGAGNDPESLYNLWSVVLVYGWFNADRSTLRETAGAVIRGLSLPAGRPTPQGVVSALCSRIGTRLETLIPVSRTALLSTTRLTRLEVLRRPGREAAQVVIGEIFQFLTSVRLELERIQRSGEDSLE